MELRWPDEPCTLIGDAVVLRPWETVDAHAMVRACNDPEVARWTTVPSPYTTADAASFIEAGPTSWAARTAMCFAVEAAPTFVARSPGPATGSPALVGSMSVVDVAADLTVAEIGYWTAPWARRRGLTAEALDVLSSWLLNDVGLPTLRLVIDPVNVGSVAVARRSGFSVVEDATGVRPLRDDHVVWQRGA